MSTRRRRLSENIVSAQAQRECWNCGHQVDISRSTCPDCGELESNDPYWTQDDLNLKIQVEELPRGILVEPIDISMLDLTDEDEYEEEVESERGDDDYPDDDEDEYLEGPDLEF